MACFYPRSPVRVSAPGCKQVSVDTCRGGDSEHPIQKAFNFIIQYATTCGVRYFYLTIFYFLAFTNLIVLIPNLGMAMLVFSPPVFSVVKGNAAPTLPSSSVR
jgi:hypothetical protein